MNKAVEFVKDCGIFYIATCDLGKPRVRPFGAITEFEGKVYITTGSPKHVFRQMIEHPFIEIAATAKDGSWIRITSGVKRSQDKAAKEAVISEYPEIKSIYEGRQDEYSVFQLIDAKAILHSAAGDETIVM